MRMYDKAFFEMLEEAISESENRQKNLRNSEKNIFFIQLRKAGMTSKQIHELTGRRVIEPKQLSEVISAIWGGRTGVALHPTNLASKLIYTVFITNFIRIWEPGTDMIPALVSAWTHSYEILTDQYKVQELSTFNQKYLSLGVLYRATRRFLEGGKDSYLFELCGKCCQRYVSTRSMSHYRKLNCPFCALEDHVQRSLHRGGSRKGPLAHARSKAGFTSNEPAVSQPANEATQSVANEFEVTEINENLAS